MHLRQALSSAQTWPAQREKVLFECLPAKGLQVDGYVTRAGSMDRRAWHYLGKFPLDFFRTYVIFGLVRTNEQPHMLGAEPKYKSRQRHLLTAFPRPHIKAIAPTARELRQGTADIVRMVTMSHGQYKPNCENLKAGEVIAQEVGGKIVIWAYNFQKRETIDIGTIEGQTYETVKALYQRLDAFCLPHHEYGTIKRHGARFIRNIPSSKKGTFSISVQDFEIHKEPVYDRRYGPQWAVNRRFWQFTPTIAKRNSIIDNPPVETPGPVLPRDRQLSLFDGHFSPKPAVAAAGRGGEGMK